MKNNSTKNKISTVGTDNETSTKKSKLSKNAAYERIRGLEEEKSHHQANAFCSFCLEKSVAPVLYSCRQHLACHYCVYTAFNTHKKLTRDASSYEAILSCPSCRIPTKTSLNMLEFVKPEDLSLRLLEIRLADIVVCPYCQESYPMHHIYECTSRKLNCQMCGEDLSFNSSLLDHVNFRCDGYKCSDCNGVKMNRLIYLQHMAINKCSEAGVFAKKGRTKIHRTLVNLCEYLPIPQTNEEKDSYFACVELVTNALSVLGRLSSSDYNPYFGSISTSGLFHQLLKICYYANHKALHDIAHNMSNENYPLARELFFFRFPYRTKYVSFTNWQSHPKRIYSAEFLIHGVKLKLFLDPTMNPTTTKIQSYEVGIACANNIEKFPSVNPSDICWEVKIELIHPTNSELILDLNLPYDSHIFETIELQPVGFAVSQAILPSQLLEFNDSENNQLTFHVELSQGVTEGSICNDSCDKYLSDLSDRSDNTVENCLGNHSTASVEELLCLCEYIQSKSITKLLEDYCLKYLSVDNAALLLELADTYELTRLRNKCMESIAGDVK